MTALYNHFTGGVETEARTIECWDIAEIAEVHVCFKDYYDTPCVTLAIFDTKEICDEYLHGEVTTRKALTPEEVLKSIDKT